MYVCIYILSINIRRYLSILVLKNTRKREQTLQSTAKAAKQLH